MSSSCACNISEILTDDMVDDMRNSTTNKTALTEALLVRLPLRGPSAFSALTSGLKYIRQEYIVEHLEEFKRDIVDHFQGDLKREESKGEVFEDERTVGTQTESVWDEEYSSRGYYGYDTVDSTDSPVSKNGCEKQSATNQTEDSPRLHHKMSQYIYSQRKDMDNQAKDKLQSQVAVRRLVNRQSAWNESHFTSDGGDFPCHDETNAYGDCRRDEKVGGKWGRVGYDAMMCISMVLALLLLMAVMFITLLVWF